MLSLEIFEAFVNPSADLISFSSVNDWWVLVLLVVFVVKSSVLAGLTTTAEKAFRDHVR